MQQEESVPSGISCAAGSFDHQPGITEPALASPDAVLCASTSACDTHGKSSGNTEGWRHQGLLSDCISQLRCP